MNDATLHRTTTTQLLGLLQRQAVYNGPMVTAMLAALPLVKRLKNMHWRDKQHAEALQCERAANLLVMALTHAYDEANLKEKK